MIGRNPVEPTIRNTRPVVTAAATITPGTASSRIERALRTNSLRLTWYAASNRSAGADASLIYAPAANSPAFDLVDGTNSGFLLSFDSIDGGVDDFIDVSFLSVDIFVGSAVAPRPPTGIPGPTGEAQWLSDPLDPAKSINESASPFEFFIPFDDFETTDGFISFSNIKSIQVDFNYFDPMDDDLTAIQGVDFKLTSIIATVPEPSSMALAALGLLASFIGTSRTRRRRRD